MSRGKVLSLPLPEFGNLAFPDLAQRLEKYLAQVKKMPDADHLLAVLNSLMKLDRFSEEQCQWLKRLRQRAYDKKRRHLATLAKTSARCQTLPNEIPDPFPDNARPLSAKCQPKSPKSQTLSTGTSDHQHTFDSSHAETNPPNFWTGVGRALRSIDGEHFAKTFFKSLLWFMALCPVIGLLFWQSISLYRSAGFNDAYYAAAGGLIMLIGFAAYYSIAPSFLALMLCLFAGGYEAFLMVSGTVQDETQTHNATVLADPELKILEEQAAISIAKYQKYKARHQDPNSKVFDNEWFETNHLTPAWNEAMKTQAAVASKKSALLASAQSNHITWLKIFYRLGLVLLCMILVHGFFQAFLFCKIKSLHAAKYQT